MQRSVEQRHTPKRRVRPRRDPRVRYLGFTARQWPFLFVLVGNWVFAAGFYALAKLFWHWVPGDWTVGDRIALVIKVAVFAILPAVLAICIVAAQRLDPSMWVGRMAKPNSALDINTRFILNSFEQFILFFIGMAALALYCPLDEARTLIILTILFVLGRALFWVGYHYNPYVRAFGFGLTFYPMVAVYLWLMLYMVFGIRVDL
ncbi:MAG: MAPEG family protein [Methyloceanibacter sp.]